MNIIASSDRVHRCVLLFDSDERSYDKAADVIWRWWTEGLVSETTRPTRCSRGCVRCGVELGITAGAFEGRRK